MILAENADRSAMDSNIIPEGRLAVVCKVNKLKNQLLRHIIHLAR